MRTSTATIILVSAVVALGGPATVSGAGQSDGADRGFVKTFYYPPADRDMGRLYRPALNLLREARSLPEKVELASPPAAAKGTQTERTKEYRKEFIRIVSEPVVPLKKQARLWARTGAWSKAADAYARLSEQAPQNKHYRLMHALAGRLASGKPIKEKNLDVVLDEEGSSSAWEKWVRQTEDFSRTLKKRSAK